VLRGRDLGMYEKIEIMVQSENKQYVQGCIRRVQILGGERLS